MVEREQHIDGLASFHAIAPAPLLGPDPMVVDDAPPFDVPCPALDAAPCPLLAEFGSTQMPLRQTSPGSPAPLGAGTISAPMEHSDSVS